MTWVRNLMAAVPGVALFLLLGWALLPNLSSVVAPPGIPQSFGSALWSNRSLDLIVQSFLLLTGVLAVLLLLKASSKEGLDG